MAVVGKFSAEDDKTKFENLSWKMQLPAAAVLEDETQRDGISVYSSVSVLVLIKKTCADVPHTNYQQ